MIARPQARTAELPASDMLHICLNPQWQGKRHSPIFAGGPAIRRGGEPAKAGRQEGVDLHAHRTKRLLTGPFFGLTPAHIAAVAQG